MIKRSTAGIVRGTCTDCAPSRSSFEINLPMSEVLDELLGGLGKPVLAGVGHRQIRGARKNRREREPRETKAQEEES